VRTLAGGGSDQTITPPGTVTDFRLVGSARFSPDGKRVAFGLAKADPSAEQGYVAVSDGLEGQSNFLTTIEGGYYTVVAWLDNKTLLLQNNTLACNPDCTNSLWTIGVDGANLTKLTDGTFLTFVAGS
jgi:tricorn protease-like protein